MVVTTPPVERAAESNDVVQLVDLVHGVVRSSLHHVHPTLAKEGITMGQFWAIHTVSSLEAASLSTVARYLGVSAPTVCANLDQLEAAGLLRRHRSQRDRRAVELSLTPRGRKVEARVWEEITRVMSKAARGSPPADVAAAVRVFRELGRRLEPVAPAPREGP
ncbi:MAG: MarR family winged helix-turn-helix transcriptional regulator [Thermoplasmata archaeon]|jgi:DNA-binding MarR family transcriptional regulator